jgi:hypothetical protein
MVTRRRKRAAIVFAGIAIVAMVVLAAAFHSLELSPEWHPLPPRQPAEATAPSLVEPEGVTIPTNLYAVMLVLLLASMVTIVILGLVSRKTRKGTIRNLLIILSLTAILLILGSPPETSEPVTLVPGSALPFGNVAVPTSAAVTPATSPEYAATQPSWMGWAIAICAALLVATGLVAGGWFVWRASHPPLATLDQFADQAQAAIDALLAGADPSDTVLRCYLEMSRVLRKERGLSRNEAMTAREFEASLGQAGLPNEPVRQLTRLFETVRYGAKVSGGTEGRQAVACLTAIVQACRAAP